MYFVRAVVAILVQYTRGRIVGNINYNKYKPRKNSRAGRILALIKNRPDAKWTAATLAFELQLQKMSLVYAPLNDLIKAGLIESRRFPAEYKNAV